MIGQRISHYEIVAKLGSGASGEVYKARDLSLNRFVALKFLRHDQLLDEESRLRFKNEARAVSTLDHPSIATVFEIDEIDNSVFISMAYYEGTTLQQFLSRGPLSFDQIHSIAIQIVQGLTEAHGIAVIHRDIKPANIIITKTGQVRILDFGIAKVLGSTQVTQQGTVLGTLAYMSPEMVQGQTVDHRTDIYSFGAVLYEMIAGAQPFGSDCGMSVIYSVVNEEPPPLFGLRPDTPRQLEAVVNRAMAKDVSDRYQTARDIETDLRAVQLQGEGAPRVRKTGRTVHLSRWHWTILGGIFLLVLLLSSLFVLRPTDRPGVEIASIAIMPFSFQGDEELSWLGKAMTDLVSTNLAESASLNVLGARERRKILRARGLENSDLDESQALQVARKAGMDAVLLGSLKKTGEIIGVTGQIFETENGRLLSKLDPLESPQAELFDAAANTSLQVVDALHLEEKSVASVDVGERMPSSLDALRYYIEGRDAALDLRYEEGIEKLTKAISLDSTFVTAYYFLAWQYENIGNKAKAMEIFAEGRPYVSHLSLEKKLRYLSEEARLDRRWKDHSAYLERLIKIRPHNAVLLYSYARVQYLHFRQIDVGINALLKSLQLDSTYSATNNSLGYAYLAKGDKEKALVALQQNIIRNPSGVNPLDTMAEALLYIGRYEEAIALCERIKSSEPGYQYSNLRLAKAYLALGKYSRASTVLDDHMQHAMSSSFMSKGQSLRAYGHFLKNELQTASQAAEQAIQLDSTNLEGHWLRGRILLRLNLEDNFQTELATLNQTLARKRSLKDVWLLHHLRGEAALQAHDFESAIESFQKAMSLAPLDRAFYFSALATAYEQSGQLLRAVNHYNSALRFNPNDALSNFKLARTYEKLGRISEALAAYGKVLEVWSGADYGIKHLITAKEKVASLNVTSRN